MDPSTYIHTSASRGGVGGKWRPNIERGAILLAVATVATAAPPLFPSFCPRFKRRGAGLVVSVGFLLEYICERGHCCLRSFACGFVLANLFAKRQRGKAKPTRFGVGRISETHVCMHFGKRAYDKLSR